MSASRKRVLIRNVYYMMAYAFRALDLREYEKLKTEEFDRIDDLMAAILAIGVNTQRKRGFERGYREVEEDIPSVKGRVRVGCTARNRIEGRHLASCAFDEFDEDTYKNRILKRTIEVLVSSDDVGRERRRELKRCLLFLRDVSAVDETRIEWNRLRYDRNNGSYLMLMNVCYMVLSSTLLTEEKGDRQLASFASDRQLHALYEKFVLEYFRWHYGRAIAASAKIIDRGPDEPPFLPSLNTDVTLECGHRTLIIDCKFYGRILNGRFRKKSLVPANVNQIYTYASVERYNTGRDVEGMLLYAKTEDEKLDFASWPRAGTMLHVRTLDLDCEFSRIAEQLDKIAQMVAGGPLQKMGDGFNGGS